MLLWKIKVDMFDANSEENGKGECEGRNDALAVDNDKKLKALVFIIVVSNFAAFYNYNRGCLWNNTFHKAAPFAGQSVLTKVTVC